VSLPAGWAETTLGHIGEYLNGRGFRKSEWRERGRPIIRIQNLTGSSNHVNYFDGEAEEHYTARRGDLLVSWAATLGVFVWDGPEAVVNQHIFKVRSRIDQSFHYYLLLSVLGDLRRQTHGSGMVHITKSRFEETPVELPPIAEQRRIVAAIEEQLSRLDAAEESLRRAQHRIETLRAAALTAASTGFPIEFGSLVSDLRYGTSLKCTYDGPGVPVLRIPNVIGGRVDASDLKRATDAEVDLSAFRVDAGDLLFVRTNGSRDLIGRVAVVDGADGMAFASYLIRARPDESRLDSKYAVIALSTPSARALIQSKAATSAGQYNLNLKALRSLPVPLPPLGEQRRIVAEVERQLSLADALQAAIGRALKRSAALRRAILERAFTGKLVPQDPSDEPASTLLERIAAERAKSEVATGRRPRRRATMKAS